MRSFEIQKNVIKEIRDDLSATPLVVEDVGIDTIFREFDSTKPSENFVMMGYQVVDNVFTHSLNNTDLVFIVNFYFTNEIMAINVLEKFYNRYKDYIFSFNNYRSMNMSQVGGITEINKNLFMSKLSFDILE